MERPSWATVRRSGQLLTTLLFLSPGTLDLPDYMKSPLLKCFSIYILTIRNQSIGDRAYDRDLLDQRLAEDAVVILFHQASLEIESSSMDVREQ
jgi:hypothetical protein